MKVEGGSGRWDLSGMFVKRDAFRDRWLVGVGVRGVW